jgi:catechol 2,3-dioxygenase-like lactoylglutathione lyase family enzyme
MPGFSFTYTGIRVRDIARSVDFYTKAMGMRVVFRMRLRKTHGEVALLKSPRSRQRLELNWYEPGSRYAKPFTVGEGLDHLAFRTGDLKQTMKELRKAGIRVVDGPHGSPKAAWIYIRDPDGLWLEINGPLAKP